MQPKRTTQLSLESAGYYIRNGTAHYLNAYPGKAFEIGDADAATFKALDSTDGRDASNVCVNGAPLADADARSFEVLDRPGFAKDRQPRLSARSPDQ